MGFDTASYSLNLCEKVLLNGTSSYILFFYRTCFIRELVPIISTPVYDALFALYRSLDFYDYPNPDNGEDCLNAGSR